MISPGATVRVRDLTSAGGSVGGAGGAPSTPDPEPPAFELSDIAGLTMWLDGRATAYSDAAGTVPATPPTGRVRRVNSLPSGSWLAASDATRPLRETNAIDIQCGNAMNLSAPADVTVTANSVTIAGSFTMRDFQGDLQTPFMGSDGVSGFGIALFSAPRIFVYSQIYWDTGVAVPLDTPVSYILRFAPGGVTLDYKIGSGSATRVSQAGTLAARTVTGLRIGCGDSVYGKSFHGAISQHAVYDTALSDADADRVLAFLVENSAPTTYPTANPLIIVAGDSQPRGFGLTEPQRQCWPSKLLPNLYATAAVKLRNAAVSGYTIAQCVSTYEATVHALYSASRQKNILLAAFGTNSIAFGSAGTYATHAAAYLAYCAQAKAHGFYVIAETVTPVREDSIPNASYSSDAAAYNALIAAGSANYNALANKAGIAGMNLGSDIPGVNFNADGVHYSDAGTTLVEAVYRPLLITALSA
jgi:hypothetical protein